MPNYILIVEDDNEINQMLRTLLQKNDYKTQSAYSGTEALLYLEKQTPQAVILDLMLPGMTGEELLQKIKERDPALPVIVASAREDVQTRVELLRAGADDYIVKPFDTEELLARLEVALRKSGRENGGDRQSGTLVFKDIVIEPDEYRVTVSGQEAAFTRREFLILELLMSNPNKVFTKHNIYESVWNEEFVGEDNAVNVHISNIRQKLARLNPEETYIQTVWGIGFKMKTL
ncbi:MAG: response regulator transcription factor [Bacteroidales bacterium]|nr:response regulator transcription factor [Bacteroidales bacterium]MCM1416509.1 response regulator transcription factor [bacterium]MCM1424487.1 response regulator transcription factor [bacterium]